MSATTLWRARLGRLVLGVSVAAMLGGAALAQQPPGSGQAPAGPVAPAAPDPASTPRRAFPGGVVGLMDITYSRLNGFRPLKLDIYKAETASAPRPLVVWLHGGGWAVGDQRGGGIQAPAYRNWPAVMAGLAARGYVVAAVSYRFTSEAKYPAQIEDVKAAVRWLRANAATYGIDPNRVVVWGASAGGQLAEVLGTSCNVAELEGPKMRGAEGSSCVQGVVDFYGPTDFSQAEAQKIPGPPSVFGDIVLTAGEYLGCEVKSCPADKLRLSNPIAFVDRSDPPFLIVHGTTDTTVPPGQSRILFDALQKAGVKSELMMVPGVAHVFQGADDALGKTILDKVYAFLDATTGVTPAN